MFRPSNVDGLLETFARMRAAMPDMAFRSTFIVGFPGETEEEFTGLLDFIRAIQFDKVGVFTFSPEPDTPACDMSGQVPEEAMEERRERVMVAQQRISLARNQLQIGRALEVLVEAHGKMSASPANPFSGGTARSQERGRGDRTVSLARSYRDAPEVDGLVVVPGKLPAGQMVQVRITGAMEYDLMGEKITSNE
jgi:ribosomal protein S12 methylthiotransferase